MMNNKWTIACISLGAMVLAFLLVFFMPAYRALNQVRAEVTLQLQEREDADGNTELSGELRSSVKKAQQRLDNCTKIVPDSSSKLVVLHAIEGLSQRILMIEAVSLRMLNSVQMLNGVGEKQLFEIRFKGGYEAAAKLLYNLTHMENLVTVESIEFFQNDNGKLDAKAVVACYFKSGQIEIQDENEEDEEFYDE